MQNPAGQDSRPRIQTATETSVLADLTRELSVALHAARLGAAIVSEVYAQDFSVDMKGPGDPVTVADRRANAAIEAFLRAEFPSDGMCTEEGDSELSSADAARGGRCWMVDPLDGTREFIRRNGEFCVMVGLAIDGCAALGVVVAPASARTFLGIVNLGAWELRSNGDRLPLRVQPPPSALRLVVSRSHPHPDVLRAAASIGITAIVPCGSVGLKAARVAAGEAHMYLHAGYGPKLWDACAPEAIARAAGADVTDRHGHPLVYHTSCLALEDGLVVAAPVLAHRAVRALAAAP